MLDISIGDGHFSQSEDVIEAKVGKAKFGESLLSTLDKLELKVLRTNWCSYARDSVSLRVERVCVDLNAARLIHRLDHLSCNIQFLVLLLLFLGLLILLEYLAIILEYLV